MLSIGRTPLAASLLFAASLATFRSAAAQETAASWLALDDSPVAASAARGGEMPAIYLPIASRQTAGKHVAVVIVFDANDQIRLMQKSEIRTPGEGDSASVEFLPGRADLRKRLATQPGRDSWRVLLRIDGRVEGEWRASDLGTSLTAVRTDVVATNLRNVNTVDLLADASSVLGGENKGFLACRNACNNAWLSCDNNCASRPIPNCEQNCDNRLANCLASCTCPTTSTYDTVSFEYTNRNTSVCMNLDTTCLNFTFSGYVFNLFNQRARTDTHTRSENCDGTVTDTITATSYSPWSICGRYSYNSLGQRRTCTTPVPGYCPYNTCAIQ